MTVRKISDYDTFTQLINETDFGLLFTSSPNCSVCHADLPRIEQLIELNEFPGFHIDISEVPMAMGQLNLFSSPTVILFYQGKEYHRQVRIIDFNELLYRMQEIKANA